MVVLHPAVMAAAIAGSSIAQPLRHAPVGATAAAFAGLVEERR